MQFKKLKNKKIEKKKAINDYAKLINKKGVPKVRPRKWIIKKNMKKIEDKQFTTNLINHNKKQIEFFEGRKKKDNIKTILRWKQ